MQKVLALVSQAIATGKPCPTNSEMTAVLGYASTSTVSTALADLERAGVVVVERFCEARRVRLAAGGDWTALDPALMKEPSVPWHLRRRVHRVQPKKRSRRDGSKAPQHGAGRADVIDTSKLEVVYRNPCPWCGTRRDIGCAHLSPLPKEKF